MSGTRPLQRGEAVALSSLSTSRKSPGEFSVHVRAHGGTPDVVALLLGPDGGVASDRDLVFFNQPVAAGGAVSVDVAGGAARIDTRALEDRVARVLVACAGAPLETGRPSSLRIDIAHPGAGVLATAGIDVPADHRAENLLEVYRWGHGWRIRVLGDGYAYGLDALVRAHGVRVEEPPAVDAAWPVPAQVAPPVAWAPPPLPRSTTPVPPVRSTRPSRPKQRRRVGALVGAGAVALLAVVLVVVLAVAFGGGADQPTPRPVAATPPATSSSPTPSAVTLAPATTAAVPVASTVQAELAQLAVKGRAPMTGYDRSQFGQEWADVDRNGCDKRIICTAAS